MNAQRRIAFAAGVLFLIAMAASLLGGGLLESVLNAPEYLTTAAEKSALAMTGVFLELANAVAVTGIAFMLYPVLKQYSEWAAMGYVCFRTIESVFCTASALVPLSLLTLSQEFNKAGVSDSSCFQTLWAVLTACRAHLAGILIPVFFSLGALLLYSVLYRSLLLPRFISVWGFLGVATILLVNLFEFSIGITMLLALPIILNELFLGIWLIARGFNTPTVDSRTGNGQLRE